MSVPTLSQIEAASWDYLTSNASESPVATSWASGDMGDPRVPGPSTYWLDSIVELNPATVADLKARYQPAPTTRRPDVWETLTGRYLLAVTSPAAH